MMTATLSEQQAQALRQAIEHELRQLERFQHGPLTWLGKGGFAHVLKVRDSLDGKERAIKVMLRGDLQRHHVREVVNHHCVSTTGHAHIIGFKEVFLTRNFLCIMMQCANGGTLVQYVRHLHRPGALYPKQPQLEHSMRKLFQQLILAVDYTHSQGIADRDIKLDNILLNVKPNAHLLILQLCDFGYSRVQNHSGDHTAEVGTHSYAAPETLDGQHPDYDFCAADVWSCGVVLYVMLFADFPFGRSKTTPVADLLQKMHARDYPLDPAAGISPECIALLNRMLDPDPTTRITIADIFEDGWFQAGLPPSCCQYNASLAAAANNGRGPRQSKEEVLRVLRCIISAGHPYAEEIQRVLDKEEQTAAG